MSVETVEAPAFTEETLEFLTNIVAVYARRYPLVDPADLRQQLYLMWHDRAKYVARYLADEDEGRGRGKLLRSMSSWAYEYCIAETAAIRGYKAEDVCHYSRKQLRGLLPLLGEPTAWTTLAVRPDDGGRRCGAPLAERGEELAVLADLRAGLGKLSDDDRNLLLLRFIETGVGDPHTGEEEEAVWLAQEMACEQYGIAPDTARKRISRAVSRLQRALGGPRLLYVQGSNRHSMSNAAAQVRTRTEYAGR